MFLKGLKSKIFKTIIIQAFYASSQRISACEQDIFLSCHVGQNKRLPRNSLFSWVGLKLSTLKKEQKSYTLAHTIGAY